MVATIVGGNGGSQVTNSNRRPGMVALARQARYIVAMLTEAPSIGFLLHDVARAYRAMFDDAARALGVTRQQWRTLLILAQVPGISQAALAERLDVERISSGRMVDRLVAAGLVERRPHATDRRVWQLFLTTAAAPLVERLSGVGRQVEATALAALTRDEALALHATLSRLRDHMRDAIVADTAQAA